MMELFFEVLYALLGIYAIVDYRDIFFFVFPLCLCFSSLLGFISSLPQLAWDKRLCCCYCCPSLSVGNVDVRPFLLTTVEVIC
jgi:hypothetical protein